MTDEERLHSLLGLLAEVRADERQRVAREVQDGEFSGHNTSSDDRAAIAAHVRTLPADWTFSGFGSYLEFQ